MSHVLLLQAIDYPPDDIVDDVGRGRRGGAPLGWSESLAMFGSEERGKCFRQRDPRGGGRGTLANGAGMGGCGLHLWRR